MGEPPTRDYRTDEQVIAALNRGDDSAFETLYLRYRDYVLQLAYRFTGHHGDAQDVVQEAFIYLLNKTPNLHLSAAMTTLLYTVTKHASLNLLRKRRREGRLVREDVDLTTPPALVDSTRSELAAVMRGLSDAQREVLLMRFIDGLSLAEIAVVLEIPLGTVKSRLHNAITNLRADPRARDYFGQ